MRILLIYPDEADITGSHNIGGISEPLALEYLSAGAKLDSHDVRILDLRLHQEDLLLVLNEFRPEIVGVTGYSMHVLRNQEICRRVKSLLPDCYTICGGHHATLMPEDFFEPQVDYVVTHEGVKPFRVLVRALEQGESTDSIPGVWAQNNGEFKLGDPPWPFDIDELPLPDRDAVRAERPNYKGYPWVHYKEMEAIALVRTSVGCPYRCAFCALWTIMKGKYHRRNIDSVVEELETIQENCVAFVDDEPFVDAKRMGRMAQAIRGADIRKRFFAYCRADTMLRHKEVIRQWKEIGLERLLVGIEFIQPREIKEFNKNLQVADVEDCLEFADLLGLKVFAQFIVSPDWTQRDFDRLRRFIQHHRIAYPSFSVMTPIPGTPLLESFDCVIERQPNGRPNWSLFDFQHPVTRTRMPKEQFMSAYLNLRDGFSAYADYCDPYERAARRRRLDTTQVYS